MSFIKVAFHNPAIIEETNQSHRSVDTWSLENQALGHRVGKIYCCISLVVLTSQISSLEVWLFQNVIRYGIFSLSLSVLKSLYPSSLYLFYLSNLGQFRFTRMFLNIQLHIVIVFYIFSEIAYLFLTYLHQT